MTWQSQNGTAISSSHPFWIVPQESLCLKNLFWQCVCLYPCEKCLPTNNDYFQHYHALLHFGRFWHDYCKDALHTLYNFLLVCLPYGWWLGGNLSLGLFFVTVSPNLTPVLVHWIVGGRAFTKENWAKSWNSATGLIHWVDFYSEILHEEF